MNAWGVEKLACLAASRLLDLAIKGTVWPRLVPAAEWLCGRSRAAWRSLSSRMGAAGLLLVPLAWVSLGLLAACRPLPSRSTGPPEPSGQGRPPSTTPLESRAATVL